MKTLFLLKRNTPLAQKGIIYHNWKYSGKRWISFIAVMSNGVLKVQSTGGKGDHFPEWVSPRTIHLELKENNLIQNPLDKVLHFVKITL